MKSGLGCGIGLQNYNDVKVGDVIEVFNDGARGCDGVRRRRSARSKLFFTSRSTSPGAQSLKDKRMVLRRIKDRLQKFNVAVAELEHQDLWQRASLGVVAISNTTIHVEQELAAAADEIERLEPGLISRSEVEYPT